jgi:hypothetical protein
VGPNVPIGSASILWHLRTRLPEFLHHDGTVSLKTIPLPWPYSYFHRNTVTGHLSVIYTVECQIDFTLRLIDPILRTLPSSRSRSLLPRFLTPSTPTIEVKREAAVADSAWTQQKAKHLVWSSGCVNWAVDPKTGLNNMMYPDYQFLYWLRSIFVKKSDFLYRDEKTGQEVNPRSWVRTLGLLTGTGLLVTMGVVGSSWPNGDEILRRLKGLDPRAMVNQLKTIVT